MDMNLREERVILGIETTMGEIEDAFESTEGKNYSKIVENEKFKDEIRKVTERLLETLKKTESQEMKQICSQEAILRQLRINVMISVLAEKAREFLFKRTPSNETREIVKEDFVMEILAKLEDSIEESILLNEMQYNSCTRFWN